MAAAKGINMDANGSFIRSGWHFALKQTALKALLDDNIVSLYARLWQKI